MIQCATIDTSIEQDDLVVLIIQLLRNKCKQIVSDPYKAIRVTTK
jgi:hypothetical protein